MSFPARYSEGPAFRNPTFCNTPAFSNNFEGMKPLLKAEAHCTSILLSSRASVSRVRPTRIRERLYAAQSAATVHCASGGPRLCFRPCIFYGNSVPKRLIICHSRIFWFLLLLRSFRQAYNVKCETFTKLFLAFNSDDK